MIAGIMMDFKKLEFFLENEPGYRSKQIEKALYHDLIEDWSHATSLPNYLRTRLNSEFPIDKYNNSKVTSLVNNTLKNKTILGDGLAIESVLMMYEGKRNTVCVSSQAGCPLGCIFCKTGEIGFKRNLEVFEIIGQVLFFARYLKKAGTRITNIVFMGMGEPFLNFTNVSEAIGILNNKEKLNIGARHISVSTAGLPDGIRKFANIGIQANLAISLNAPNNGLRTKIMPINKKHPIGKLMKAASYYVKKTKRRVMFEYVLIKDLNDSLELAEELAGLLKNYLYFVNLIPYNGKGKLKPPSTRTISSFKKILKDNHINVTERFRFGRDINAACGQLACNGKNN